MQPASTGSPRHESQGVEACGDVGGSTQSAVRTDGTTFERIVREKYVPSFAEFADGRVKTNDPNLLRQFQSVFGL